MGIHVVGFKDLIRFDGNTPVFKGRALLDEYRDTAQYKKLKPGDCEIPYPRRSKERWDFVATTPFNADLEITNDWHFSGPTASLYCQANNTYYPMFLTDFVYMASNTIIDNGKISGQFGYVKRNKNFGITYLGEKVDE